ncbi:Hypothetical protein FKW44_024139 [Caligus rogercresseyi]|uniref:Uncharacterized protein n=1 Tax=Caligus rogercresseyi TaxID=217165 RepID=A0A7T8GMK3_CALRO|nr:Hypothetical protein FKW44_024139 [Caligus rogercresseyi]
MQDLSEPGKKLRESYAPQCGGKSPAPKAVLELIWLCATRQPVMAILTQGRSAKIGTVIYVLRFGLNARGKRRGPEEAVSSMLQQGNLPRGNGAPPGRLRPRSAVRGGRGTDHLYSHMLWVSNNNNLTNQTVQILQR